VRLQTQAPPMAWEVVEATLRIALGDDIERRFSENERTPLAAAPIGQVHRTRLRDRTRVAIKVQYPRVDRAIAADLDNYGMLSGMLQAVTPTMDAGPIVEELRARLSEELDYEKEAESSAGRSSSHSRDPCSASRGLRCPVRSPSTIHPLHRNAVRGP
jgi:predicted unusual protein kinase regulating ubiquinone biosynthesis (AarF/ABC1/UbiB family)